MGKKGGGGETHIHLKWKNAILLLNPLLSMDGEFDFRTKKNNKHILILSISSTKFFLDLGKGIRLSYGRLKKILLSSYSDT